MTFVDNGDGTATLSGTPDVGSGGIYTFTITATNGVAPDATQTFTLTDNEAPSITSANSTTFGVGTLGSFTVTTGHSFPADVALQRERSSAQRRDLRGQRRRHGHAVWHAGHRQRRHLYVRHHGLQWCGA